MSKENVRMNCCCGSMKLMRKEKHSLFLVLREVGFGFCVGV